MNTRLFFKAAVAAVVALSAATAGAQTKEELSLKTRRLAPAEKFRLTTVKEPGAGLMKPLNVSKSKRVANNESDYFGRKIYGAMVNSSTWNNASIANVPYGLYSFDISDAPDPEAYMTNLSYYFYGGAYYRGKFFGIYPMLVMGALNGARYITLDTENKTLLKEVVYGTDEKTYSLLPAVMAYNPIDNFIYSLQYNEDLSGMDWCTYNHDYDTMDKIATFRGKYNILTLAATPSGDMYFINEYGDLYKIDKSNGRPSRVASTGITPTLYTQAMMYDGKTAKFIWAAQTEEGSMLYAVDPETAETSLITTFNNNEQFSALYSLDNEAKAGAPGNVSGLKLDYDAEGSLNGTISFTVPSTTFGGGTLSTPTLNVWLDGENLKGVAVNAGETVSIPVTLTEGNHYVAVNTSNDEGYSPLATVYQYAGYDIPLQVGDVSFTHTDDNNNTVAWSAPTGGANDGYVDFDNLKYTVVRMPDSVTVAQNIAETSFTEATPTVMHNYSYRVYAVNNGKMGAYTESNQVICGNANTVPYYQSFADNTVLADFFTVIDANNDDNTWRTGYNNDVRIDINMYNPTGDDWLITPAITLEEGNKYRFTLNLKTFMKGYPEDFELYYGTDPNDLSTFVMFDKEENFELYEAFADFSADFNVTATDNYYLAIRYISDNSKQGSMLMLNSVSVTKVGSSNAPAGVKDLTVTPDADDEMEATISFTTPAEDLTGNAISSISKVNIYRNNATEPVKVFESPAVGTQLSWTDTNVEKVGTNTYSVVAENDFGAGETISDSAFVGVYVAPYIQTFDTSAAAEEFTSTISGVDPDDYSYYGWSYQSYNQSMNLYAYTLDACPVISTWLYTPKIKLDANSVYSFSYDANMSVTSETVTNKVYMGTDTTEAAQTIFIGDMPRNTSYAYQTVSHNVVTTDAGKYYFGFNSMGTGLYDYMGINLDNVSLTYLKSALSPYQFTDYKSTAATDGSLKAELSFKAPAVDYHGDALTSEMEVEIFRGQGATPVYSVSGVTPGAAISWTDAQPMHGLNYYLIVATNEYGRSEVYTDTLFVGRDRPASVENCTLRGSDDNMDAIFTWDAPSEGINGGIVIQSELTYNIYSFDISDYTYTLIAENITGNTFTIDNGELSKQSVYYYAIAAQTDEGISDTLLYQVVLGKLYETPFKESFSNVSLSTSPWLVSSESTTYYNWGVTNPDPSGEYAYNGASPQDNDGGCAYMYNGMYYEIYGGAGFISPKVALDNETDSLSFWIYNINTAYPNNKPQVVVYLRADDGDYDVAGTYVVGSDTEEGWKRYVISLDKYKGNNYISFAFYAFTGGYGDVIYLDNVNVYSATTTGINGIAESDKTIDRVNYYDVSGREVINPSTGVYIRTITYTDGTKKSDKFTKR